MLFHGLIETCLALSKGQPGQTVHLTKRSPECLGSHFVNRFFPQPQPAQVDVGVADEMGGESADIRLRDGLMLGPIISQGQRKAGPSKEKG